MRKLGLALALAGALSGCQQVTAVNNTLATLAKNDIPMACGIIDKAELYFAQIVGTPSVGVAAAEAAGKAICANPPTDTASAFATLLQVWTIVQAATVKPVPGATLVTPSTNQ